MEIICLEISGSYYGIGNSLKEAFDDIKDKITYNLDLEEVIFYEAKEIKVKQQLIKIEDGNS